MADPKTAPAPDFSPSGFFVFRTPLLPYEELEAWADGLSASEALDDPERLAEDDLQRLTAAVAADRALLRSRLAGFLERPEVLEALFLASPSLVDGLDAWRADPASKKGSRAERALVRYLLRMAARATPFGLFSGCTTGEVGEETRLRVAPRAAYQRHTRLDMDYLFALAEALGRDPEVRRDLLYRPNSSLYRAAGRLRYAEARLDGKVRSHHLVALEPTEYLEDTLRRAAEGARAAELAAALVASDPDGEIELGEAEGYVEELIESQVLVSDLALPVTGPEAALDLAAQLERLPAARAAAERLAAANATLAELDATGPGAPPERYREIAASLEPLPTPVELARLFQLDMVKPGDRPTLGAEVLAELSRAIALLRPLAGRPRQDSFDTFRKDFSERYGDGRWVPLAEVLDEEVGIGFERSGSAGAEASPLLRGIAAAPPGAEPTIGWGGAQMHRVRLLERARGEQEIELTPKDLELLAAPGGDPLPLPDAFQVMATVAAASEEDLAAGRFKVLFRGAGGPSGARILGRFCHADPELSPRVEEHLRAEEEHRPEAVFAEIVHLPQGRIGNILSRPVLRRWEIPFLGRSGAPAERQIPVSDLDVTVAGQRIVLRSRRLGKEVVPRLTSAHNYSRGSLGVYRFLCALQSQGVAAGLGWGWGPLDAASFLPRVSVGRLVLERARWRMEKEEIEPLVKATGAARFAAVQRWREERRLPRLVTLADGDNELLVDLENALAIDTFIDLVEERSSATLHELFPEPEELLARGPEGRFVHEIVVPYTRFREERPAAAAEARGRAALLIEPVRRSFPPGSEWLYAKLYTGSATADRVLREAVAPVVERALGSGAARAWFFIRYGDPEWHVRLRFTGEPAALVGRVLPELQAAVAPLLEDGRLWKVQLDTYDREVERYGGPAGIELAEQLFAADSEAALAIVETLEGDEGADARWRLALRGTDMLLGDLGLDAAGKLAVLTPFAESYFREFGGGKPLRVQLDAKFRAERRGIEALLDPANDAESELAPGFAILARRTERHAPIIAELQRRAADGRLTVPIQTLAQSYAHMHVNRMIRSAARAHELVLYDLLRRLYESRAARERKKAG